jgi:hypothetical protein
MNTLKDHYAMLKVSLHVSIFSVDQVHLYSMLVCRVSMIITGQLTVWTQMD